MAGFEIAFYAMCWKLHWRGHRVRHFLPFIFGQSPNHARTSWQKMKGEKSWLRVRGGRGLNRQKETDHARTIAIWNRPCRTSANSLEKELQLNETCRTISAELKEALKQTILPNVADKNKNYLFSTLWTLILKAENKMVGDLCFIGEPNAAGEIEIGYGTYEPFRKKGLMTEAVAGMIKWAKEQPDVKAIIAGTDKTNPASFSVLQKNNFTKIGETEPMFQWQLKTAKTVRH